MKTRLNHSRDMEVKDRNLNICNFMTTAQRPGVGRDHVTSSKAPEQQINLPWGESSFSTVEPKNHLTY